MGWSRIVKATRTHSQEVLFEKPKLENDVHRQQEVKRLGSSKTPLESDEVGAFAINVQQVLRPRRCTGQADESVRKYRRQQGHHGHMI